MPYLGDSYSSEDTLEILKNYSDSVTFENLKKTLGLSKPLRL